MMTLPNTTTKRILLFGAKTTAISTSIDRCSPVTTPPSSATLNDLPILELPEHSQALDLMFRLCYPEPVLVKYSIEAVSEGLEASRKYCLESDAFVGRAAQFILKFSPLIVDEPERVYVIGVQRRWTEYHVDDLKSISGLEVFPLLRFQESVNQAATTYVAMLLGQVAAVELIDDNYDQVRSAPSGHSDTCVMQFTMGPSVYAVDYDCGDNPPPIVHCILSPEWWRDFLWAVARKYAKLPYQDAFTDAEIINEAVTRATYGCSKCKEGEIQLAQRLRDWAIDEEEVPKLRENLTYCFQASN
ncbi:hypothetical protein D9757_007616 [Collybiopsis confluens]|uniref:Uncharacterized protein n=1 Tax=Collybiopsis confluens TaxID=2823264 RepID=A0A8H5H9B3_9AGAR|nr:hypothetical protein D9757_007616 [Collybiopsis confluens]